MLRGVSTLRTSVFRSKSLSGNSRTLRKALNVVGSHASQGSGPSVRSFHHHIPAICNCMGLGKLGQGSLWRRGIHAMPPETGDGGGAGNGDNNGGGRGGDGGQGDDDEEEYLNLQQAEELAASKGVELPADYAAIAQGEGIRASVLSQYCALATTGFFTSLLTKSIPAFRDRLIADKLYFYKLLVEIVIDSGCATVAEVRKRGDEFWNEFEFYLSDMLVGLVMDVVLVSLLAPVAVAGKKRSIPASGLKKWSSQLPAAVFEKSKDKKYTWGDRAGCFVARGLEYSLAGMVCGFVGQGIASGLMTMKRQYMGSTEGDVEVPPVFESALVWGAFMGVSANTRYQIVFGLERIVDETVARRVPQIAYLTTLAIRFANNIVGGEQFIDMARWAGVQ